MTREHKVNSKALDQAAQWAARLASEDASEADWLGFEAWLAHPQNREAYARLEMHVEMVADHAADLRLALTSVDRKGARQIGEKVRRAGAKINWYVWGAGLAAATAAIAFVVIPALNFAPLPIQAEMLAYAAPNDGSRVITLADGSEVTLNRGASLRADVGGAERRVELSSGEAAFKVVHDATRPFQVAVGKEVVVDLGTEFNVLNTSSTLEVTVRSGRVRVDLSFGQPVHLPAGQQMMLDRVARQAVVSKVNADDVFAWQDGRLVFHNAPLSEVVEQLNRYADKPINMSDQAVASLHFSGVLVIGSSANMVEQLQAFFPIRADEDKEAFNLKAK